VAKRDPEEWTEQDLDRLLAQAFSSLDEALTCRKAGATLAALAMLAGAFEGALLAAVVAGQDELAAAHQPQPCPSRLHLSELVAAARSAGWLSDSISDEVVQILNTVRTMAVHPGAFVRGMRQIPDDDYDLADPVGFDVVYDLVARASEHLARATAASSGKTAPDSDA
jgi:hypothetical protein